MLETSIAQNESILEKLNQHIHDEIAMERKRTRAMQGLHRTIIRAATALLIIAILLMVVTKDTRLIELLTKPMGL